MDFLPTDEQRALQEGVRDLLAARRPKQRRSEGFDPSLWRELTEIGVFGLRAPESSSGLGLGMAEATLVFEELGRALVPGPLVATHLAATHLSDALAALPGDAGSGPVTLLDTSGEPVLVGHLGVSGSVAVLSPDGVSLAPSSSVPATEVGRPLDPQTPLYEVAQVPSGASVGAPVEGPGGGPDLAARWRREGAVLTGALQVGIADTLTSLAVEYAGQREQFGRVIGSFQAVKHLCADMLVRAELARAAVHAAAVTLDDPEVGDIRRAVASAKLLADDAATTNGRACVQVHGGMGYTWEVVVHFYLKRAWLHATEFGSAEDHAEDLADLL
jgi:alkylation response protein AidB-like acyl-CoA dehydrogenase